MLKLLFRIPHVAGISYVLIPVFFIINLASASAQSITTQHNDLKRTGWYAGEKQLTVQKLSSGSFGKIFTRSVDDQIYTQPLIVNQVSINGGLHNIVLVATVNNSVYAFNADDSSVSAPYWQTNLTYNPGNANAYRPVQNSDMTGACNGNYKDFSGKMGIVGTPVIDTNTQSLYVVSRSVTKTGSPDFVQYLHVLDLITGAEKTAPVFITAQVPGSGDGSVGGVVTFNQQTANQRPALLLYQGVVYIAWASHCDWGPYHGWIIGYDAATLARKYVYNASPDGGLTGIWMSGQAPAVDDDGFIYVSTGNGTVGLNGNPNDTTNRGESLLKLSTASGNLKVADFFTPGDFQYLNDLDLDYGVDGVLLIPNTHLSLSGSKEGFLYLIDNTKMGGMVANNSNVMQLIDVNANYLGEKHLHGSPVYYVDDKGTEYIYAWAEGGLLKQFPFQRSTMLFDTLNKIAGNTVLPNGMPGAMLSVSSNGAVAGTGILWASHPIHGNANQAVAPGILQAFDATDVSHELWNSNLSGIRDTVGKFAKFVPPTIANGKVYLATFSNKLLVYGLNAPKASKCPNPLPVKWTSADIGYVYYPGDVCYNNGTYTITASGDDIWNQADAFHSVLQPVAGSNIAITARVVSIQNTDPWAKCGVMFRANLDPGSPNVFMAVSAQNGPLFQHRIFQSDISAGTDVGAGIQAPYWVRISGNGNKYVGYISADSSVWTAVDSLTLALGSSPYVGLAYSSHNNAVAGTAVMDHVSVRLYADTTLNFHLTDFTGANINNQYTQLLWSTSESLNFDRFEIEHSITSTDFTKIGTVGGQGDSQTPQRYSFVDENPVNGANYYRLKMYDNLGNSAYSKTILVTFSLDIIQIYPNPALHYVYLKNNIIFTEGEPIRVELVNTLGQVIFQQTMLTAGLNQLRIELPSNLETGIYFLYAVNAKNKKQAWKIQVQH
jgi:Secretion system C-terminal sorting domain